MKLPVRALVLALLALGLQGGVEAHKKKSLVDQAIDAIESHHSYEVPAAGTVEVAFSPNEGSEALVIKVIDSARTELRVLSYSFTSAPVTQALLRARHRGVDVKLVADQNNNTSEDRSGKARAALSSLLNAGADVRTIGVYRDTVRLCQLWTDTAGCLSSRSRRQT
jgi:phosphatidylserine/phosphatidylglycerophosphate/cardiolipin synthase-like enzyme